MNFSTYMDKVRNDRPLVHIITNYVTVNDCANVTICAGGSPIMTDEVKDINDISRIASAVVLNIGTLNERTVEAMIHAGVIANKNSVPVIFDPVGAGASNYRNQVVETILSKVKVAVIKGNAGEINFIAGMGGEVRGVDSVSQGSDSSAVEALAKKYNCIAAMSGETDFVSDGEKTLKLSNGSSLMDRVSGTGCMLSCVVASYVGANGPSVESVASAITAFTVAGELAEPNSKGPGSFKVSLFDSLSNLTDDELDSMAKVQ